MERNTNNIIGWIPVQGYTWIEPIQKFLDECGWKQLEVMITNDAVPTHLILYENKIYLFSFYPSNLPDNLKIVNLFEFENFILSKL